MILENLKIRNHIKNYRFPFLKISMQGLATNAILVMQRIAGYVVLFVGFLIVFLDKMTF